MNFNRPRSSLLDQTIGDIHSAGSIWNFELVARVLLLFTPFSAQDLNPWIIFFNFFRQDISPSPRRFLFFMTIL